MWIKQYNTSSRELLTYNSAFRVLKSLQWCSEVGNLEKKMWKLKELSDENQTDCHEIEPNLSKDRSYDVGILDELGSWWHTSLPLLVHWDACLIQLTFPDLCDVIFIQPCVLFQCYLLRQPLAALLCVPILAQWLEQWREEAHYVTWVRVLWTKPYIPRFCIAAGVVRKWTLIAKSCEC
jgi:hypothetical protein